METKMDSNKTRINLLISNNEYKTFKQVSSDKEVSMSVLIRNFIKETNNDWNGRSIINWNA